MAQATGQATGSARDARAAPPAGEKIWRRLRVRLQSSLGEAVFSEWLAPLKLAALSKHEIRLVAPTGFLADWVSAHYADRILSGWRILAPEGSKPLRLAIDRPPRAGKLPPASPPVQKTLDLPLPLATSLDPRYVFKHFIIGEGNKLAVNAARKVVEATGEELPNPLFLHGGVGMGKTHLLQAIAQAAACRAAYLPADRFRFLFVGAVRRREGVLFRACFRKLNMLLLDDIQFLTGKATEEEFLHNFDMLRAAGVRMVFSASKPPSALTDLDPRIRSRLGGGLVAELTPGDYALRLKVLQAELARRRPGTLSAEMLDFLARRVTHNVRELEGALIRLLHHAEHVSEPLTEPQAAEILRDLLSSRKHQITIAAIQKKVAHYYGVPLADMLSARRQRQLVRPRQVAIWLAKNKTPASLPHLGRHFGNRDHTTIRYALQRIEALMAQDSVLREDIDMLNHDLAQTYADRTGR